MKKILISFLFFLTVVLSLDFCSNADDTIRLFYEDKIHLLDDSVLFIYNEYYLSYNDVEKSLGIKLETDKANKNVTIYNKGATNTYPVKSHDYSIEYQALSTHTTPEHINGGIYFPFEFLEKEFGLLIKYDRETGSLYFFPSDKEINAFTNISNNYTLYMTDFYSLDTSGPTDNFDDNTVLIKENNGLFSAAINCDVIDSDSIETMRTILNDYSSSEDEIFNRINEYMKSYFRAMQDLYKNDFYLGGMNNLQSESNIKVFSEYSQDVFGQQSTITLYNTLSADKNSIDEHTHISIIIPSNENRTIYSINFTVKKGTLNSELLKKMSSVIKNLSIRKLQRQESDLSIFLDKKAEILSNSGIYPDLDNSGMSYTEYINKNQSYSIIYPSTFIPYLQNSFINCLDYTSFKINYNTYFSISVEQTDSPLSAIKDKIDYLKSNYNVNNVVQKNISLSNKNFTYFKYELSENSTRKYIDKYYTVNGNKLFTLELNSSFSAPSDIVYKEFIKIVESFKFLKAEQISPNNDTKFTRFTNKEEGYSFEYPEGWKLENKSKNINFDMFSLSSFNFSGPLDIYVNEAKYSNSLTFEDHISYLTGANTRNLNSYYESYLAPYSNRIHKILSSCYKVSDNTIYIYKLVNYLDEGDRYKICFSIDIIRNKKVYSLFISTSEYITKNGALNDANLSYIVNHIADSFTTQDTPEYLKRKNDGEKRNRKVVLIERWFKIVLDSSAVVTMAKYLDSENDVLVYVDNCQDSGFYRIDFNYDEMKIIINSSVEQSVVVESTEKELRKLFKDKFIYNISFDKTDMTATIFYSNNILNNIIPKTYYVEVIPDFDGHKINLTRMFTTSSLKNACKYYLENHLLSNVDLYFPTDYSYKASKSGASKQSVPVYAEFDGLSGYFLLGIDTVEDSIEILNYIPESDIFEGLNDYLQSLEDDYSIVYYLIDKENKFQIDVFLQSKSTLTVHHYVIKANFNESTHKLEFYKSK